MADQNQTPTEQAVDLKESAKEATKRLGIGKVVRLVTTKGDDVAALITKIHRKTDGHLMPSITCVWVMSNGSLSLEDGVMWRSDGAEKGELCYF